MCSPEANTGPVPPPRPHQEPNQAVPGPGDRPVVLPLPGALAAVAAAAAEPGLREPRLTASTRPWACRRCVSAPALPSPDSAPPRHPSRALPRDDAKLCNSEMDNLRHFVTVLRDCGATWAVVETRLPLRLPSSLHRDEPVGQKKRGAAHPSNHFSNLMVTGTTSVLQQLI